MWAVPIALLFLGMPTPPFAINMFVAQSIFNVPSSKIVPGLIPFIALHTIALLLVTYIPWFSLVLLRLF